MADRRKKRRHQAIPAPETEKTGEKIPKGMQPETGSTEIGEVAAVPNSVAAAVSPVTVDAPATREPENVEDPVEILVGLAERGEIDPWNINIIEVTDRFLSELRTAPAT